MSHSLRIGPCEDGKTDNGSREIVRVSLAVRFARMSGPVLGRVVDSGIDRCVYERLASRMRGRRGRDDYVGDDSGSSGPALDLYTYTTC